MATVALSGIITPTNVVTATSTTTLTNKTIATPTITGVTTFSAGTAALPALTTSGDTNTGVFFPAADTIAFTEGGTESMRIDSSGNVGLGVTPTATSSTGIFQNRGGIFWAFSNLFQDLTQNAYYDSSYKYSVSTYAATMYRQQGGSHQWYTSPTGTAGNAITFTQSLALGKGTTLALEGASSNSGTGITFPATQSASSDANTLDDYEEGTWTTTPTSGSGSFTTVAFNNGVYTKVGNVVTCSGKIEITTAGTAAGSINLTLPFSASATAYSGSASEFNAVGFVCFAFPDSTSVMAVKKFDNTTAIGSGHKIVVSVTFRVA
jgi:hypothetical protein